ncbi:MAG: class I tRNA ligase family protein, partial [Candidatus Uhrbacteria bacterium]|nr:class I tRNA ligase family protein [Candidatus Uhrbacteria bacterium]
LASKYGMDALRYFLLREITFGEDGDFSEKRLQERYESDLGNTFGNLVNRVIAMSKKYFDGKVPQGMNQESGIRNEELGAAVNHAYASHRCDSALAAIWVGLIRANKTIEEAQPFKLIKTDPLAVAKILYDLLEACRWYAWMVYPVMPGTAEKIWAQLGLDREKELSKGWDEGLQWGGLIPGQPLGEPEPLFPRLS